MTGFGAGSATVDGEQLSVEVRAVNQKFVEVKARLPRELAALEAELVHLVKAKLARGAIDVQVHRRAVQGTPGVEIDLALAREYARAHAELEATLGLEDPVTARSLFEAEGVVRLVERPAAMEAARRALQQAVGEALGQLIAMREREGEALARDLRSRLETMNQLSQKVGFEAPTALAEHRRRLQARLKEVVAAPLDPGRLEQEVALLADRTDVAEELTRLDSHLEQFTELLARPGPAGRRLDFLSQELHREVTTLGNKSQSASIARLVIELKTEAERIREQVQNVE
jgi:uncharacterized protein (TIGR00255 family)